MLSKFTGKLGCLRVVVGYICLVANGVGYSQQDPRIACIRELQNDARFKPIAGKVPIANIQDIKFQMLSDETLPNSRERKAIAELVDAHKECIKAGESYRQRAYSPQVNALLSDADNSMIAAAAELYNRKLTFGKFNLRLQAIDIDARNKIATVMQQFKAQQEEQQARRQAEQAEQARQDAQRKANEAAQRRAEEARQEEQRRAEQAQSERQDAMRRQAEAQCSFVYKQAYNQYLQSAGSCYAGQGNAMITYSCTMLQIEAAKDYAQSAQNSCMARLNR